MFSFLKRLFGRVKPDPAGLRPAWSFRDFDSIGGAYPEPDRVDYKLDLSSSRYEVRATFLNDDPYAESEVSQTEVEHEVRRVSKGHWEIRPIRRNGYLLDQPEPWEPAPARFLDAWEKAWDERQANDGRN
ncbi:MAG: hypothetical protein KDB23_14535 [Planctomycetales bacterium]|nr:hypothetical protein [Planctomycetales bacterium]